MALLTKSSFSVSILGLSLVCIFAGNASANSTKSDALPSKGLPLASKTNNDPKTITKADSQVRAEHLNQICYLKSLSQSVNSKCHATRLNNEYFITSAHCTDGKGGALSTIDCPQSSPIPTFYETKTAPNQHYNSDNLNWWVAGDFSLIKSTRKIPGKIPSSSFIRMPKSIDEVMSFFEKIPHKEGQGSTKLNTTDPNLNQKRMSWHTYSTHRIKNDLQCQVNGGLKNKIIPFTEMNVELWKDISLPRDKFQSGYLYSKKFALTHPNEIKRGSSGGSVCCFMGNECVILGLLSTQYLWTFVGAEMLNEINTSLDEKELAPEKNNESVDIETPDEEPLDLDELRKRFPEGISDDLFEFLTRSDLWRFLI